MNSGASEDGIRIGGEHGGTASNIKIYNNLLFNIAQTGIILGNWFESGFREPKFISISIYTNTIYNTGVKSGGGILIQGSQNSGLTARTNIISKARSFNMQSSSAATISNNLFDGGTTIGSNAIMGNPLFVAAGSNNFHLQSTSPAMNTGTLTGALNFLVLIFHFLPPQRTTLRESVETLPMFIHIGSHGNLKSSDIVCTPKV